MRYQVKFIFTFCLLLMAGTLTKVSAQSDTEFPKGFIMYAEWHSGMITDFSSAPDLFAGGLRLAPQVTIIPNRVRAGILAGGFYAQNKIQGEAGPSVSVKLKSFNAALKGAGIGSVGNLNLRAEHLWGSGKQRLLGGGVFLDLGNLFAAGLTAHRDYKQQTWWFESVIGIRISDKHKNPEI